MARFTFLDGLRGVAALSVVLLHAGSVFGVGPRPNAHLAVDFFFCLSGFVVVHAYDPKLAAGMDFRAFMVSRVNRLYPMLLLGVLLGAVAGLLSGRDAAWVLSSAGLGAALVPVFWTGSLAFPVNFPMWSLFFELVASIVYGLERRRIPIRALIAGTAGLGIALAVLVVLAGGLEFGLGGRSFFAGVLRVMFPFAVGAIFARLELWKRIPSIHPAALVAALAVVVFLPIRHWSVDLVSGLVILPAIVLLGATVREDRLAPVWDYMGRLSYPLYIVHVPVMVAVKALGAEALPSAALSVALSLGLGHLALVVYDEPVRRALSRMLARRSDAAA